MLLCGDWLIPVSGAPVPDGAVLVQGGAIEAVGTATELRDRYSGMPVREFPGAALLPGLVNVHTHLDLSALRGFAPPSEFGRWMFRLLLARRKLDAHDLAASALWGAYECARSGVTTIADASSEGWTVARAARAAGLRARVYLEVFGLDDARLPDTMKRLEAGLERAEREGAGGGPGAGHRPARAPATGPAVQWGVSPHAPYTVSARLYREAARFARRKRLPLATHVAESQEEVRLLAGGRSTVSAAYRAARLWSDRSWTPPRVSPVQYVSATEALGPDTLVVHAVQVDGDDIGTLAASGATVAHCPRSNLRLRCGVAPVAELLAAGVTVGLGTDGLCSNDDLDLFAEMRAALEVSRARGVSPGTGGGLEGPLPAAILLRMVTVEGARALGMDDLIGTLEVGKRADVIAVRLPADGAAPGPPGRVDGSDPVVGLVAGAQASDVLMTMVDGTVVWEGGEIPREAGEGLAVVRGKLGLPG